MKKLLFLIVVAGLVYGFNQWQDVPVLDSPSWSQSSDNALRAAYDSRQSNLQIQGKGVVSKILPDDLSGSSIAVKPTSNQRPGAEAGEKPRFRDFNILALKFHHRDDALDLDFI
jgi:hypothetical protein